MIIDIKDPLQLALSKIFQKKNSLTFESGDSSQKFTDLASLLQNSTWGTYPELKFSFN